MSDAPTRCCAPATSGRCANTPAPFGQTRYIGPVEIAACNLPKHQAALRSLPGFTRRDGYCGADGCCKVAPSGLCIEHHNLYRRHGVLPRLLLATEPAPMPTPAAPADLPAVQSPPTPAPPRGILDRATGPGTDGASDGEEVEPDPLPPIWQPLDPGIATAVELLRAEGLATTDSGDGYSKKGAIEAGEALDYAHVIIVVPTGERAPDSPADEPDVVGILWEPGMLALHPLEVRRNALVERLKAAGFVEVPGPAEHLRRFDDTDGAVLIPIGHPCEVERDFEDTLNHAEMECAKVEAAKARQPTAPGPTVAELQEQVRALQAQLEAAKVSNAKYVCDAALSGLRIVAESAPLARVAELEAERDYERKRADEEEAEAARARGIVQSLSETITAVTAALDADPERSPAYDDKDQPIPLPRRVEIALMPDGIGHSRGERRAHELEVKLGNLEAMDYPGQLQTAIAEIETACVMLRRLGGTSYSVPDLLMQVLSPEDRRAILEVEAAEGRATIARLKARRVNPPPPEKLAEYAGKLAKVEAQIAALDHSPDAGKMVR